MSPETSPDLSENQKRLLHDIEQAFVDVSYPGDENITKVHFATCGAECIECADIRAVFRGKKWRDFLMHPYELLGYFAPREPTLTIGRGCFPLLKVEALHYYLPLFLAAMIIDPREADVMLDGTPSNFDPGPKSSNEELWEHQYARCKTLLAAMSETQRKAAAAALRFIFRDDLGGIRPTPSDAIRNLEAGQVIAWTEPQNMRDA